MVSGLASVLNRGRAASSSLSSPSSSPIEPKTSRTAPAPSVRRAYWACGSHFTQSHSASRSSAATTAMIMSSGAWKLAVWQSIERTRSSVVPRSPRSAIRLNERSDTAIGRSGMVEWARTNLRSAIAVIGSRSSTGLVSGVTIEMASRCGPIATRTSAKSSSVVRRSHIRLDAATDHSVSGSGCRQASAARCWAAARRVRRRDWARCRM